jgi:hypothetical protein
VKCQCLLAAHHSATGEPAWKHAMCLSHCGRLVSSYIRLRLQEGLSVAQKRCNRNRLYRCYQSHTGAASHNQCTSAEPQEQTPWGRHGPKSAKLTARSSTVQLHAPSTMCMHQAQCQAPACFATSYSCCSNKVLSRALPVASTPFLATKSVTSARGVKHPVERHVQDNSKQVHIHARCCVAVLLV